MYKSCTRFDIDRVETFEDSGPGIRQIKVKILRVLSELAARGLLIKALTHYQEEWTALMDPLREGTNVCIAFWNFNSNIYSLNLDINVFYI